MQPSRNSEFGITFGIIILVSSVAVYEISIFRDKKKKLKYMQSKEHEAKEKVDLERTKENF